MECHQHGGNPSLKTVISGNAHARQHNWIFMYICAYTLYHVYIHMCPNRKHIHNTNISTYMIYNLCTFLTLSLSLSLCLAQQAVFSCGNSDALRPFCLHQGVAEMKNQGFKGVCKESMIGEAWKQLSLSTDGVKMMIRLTKGLWPLNSHQISKKGL